MRLETQRLFITEFEPDMAISVHINSLDEDNRRFVPDEVFETVEEARDTIEFLRLCYNGKEGPFVYPVLLKRGQNIGYVQMVKIGEGWEIGFHIGKPYTKNGYATEAVKGFLPYMMEVLGIDTVYGICLAENTASRIVLERCGFTKKYEGMGEYQGEQRLICRYTYYR